MADTISMIAQSVQGNERVTIVKAITGASSATIDIPCGFKVAYAVVNPLNTASHNFSMRMNSMTASTAIAGISLASASTDASYIVAMYGPNGAR